MSLPQCTQTTSSPHNQHMRIIWDAFSLGLGCSAASPGCLHPGCAVDFLAMQEENGHNSLLVLHASKNCLSELNSKHKWSPKAVPAAWGSDNCTEPNGDGISPFQELLGKR